MFTEDFVRIVIINGLEGVKIRDNFWRLHVDAGKNWHQLVERTLNIQMKGLKNLTLIPGCVGAV